MTAQSKSGHLLVLKSKQIQQRVRARQPYFMSAEQLLADSTDQQILQK